MTPTTTAPAETVVGLDKNQAIAADSPFRTGPLHTVSDLEVLTMNYVGWYNEDRLHSALRNLTIEKYEQAHYAQPTGSPSGDATNKKKA